MSTDHRAKLASIRRFDQLRAYLRDEMGWPIGSASFEDITYEYTPEEIGIDDKNAAKIVEIKRMMPLVAEQPWGIFFVKFEPKRLPVVALRRILSRVTLKKRASANSSERAAWSMDDLLFVSNYGEGELRHITFAHFSEDREVGNLAALRVLGWDGQDTGLHLDHVADELTSKLKWPEEEENQDAWRDDWRSAFTEGHREVIETSKALAIRLADLARGIRKKVNGAIRVESDKGKIRTLMKEFQTSLIHDMTEDDFADTYAQTIAYGLLSASISRKSGALVAGDAALMVPNTSPFLKELMETFLNLGGKKPGGNGGFLDFDELGINDVVETLRNTNMDAVLRDFGDKNPQEDPVIHFYEDFLKEYDSKKRTQRGVFYTPRPVVSFIVRSVDEQLRNEFGLEDGLADTTTWGEMVNRLEGIAIPEGTSPDQAFVQILDPATGTGTFLVEVIDLIYKTMTEKWRAEGKMELELQPLWNDYVPKHLLPRLHGYELMMAPYAIAHMKIGLKLFETGYRFEGDVRARVYLTNALEPAVDQYRAVGIIPALAHEADTVNTIKRDQRFTVVIGNPPYARHSSNPNKDAEGRFTYIGSLVEEFKEGCPELRRPAQSKYLQDDYVKFIRFAEYELERTRVGVIGLITSHGFLDNPTFRGMRNHLLTRLTRIAVLDLHGNANKKERAPDGSKDKNVFDIKQGVAIFVGERLLTDRSCEVFHGDLWGSREKKYSSLLSSQEVLSITPLQPKPSQYSLCPRDETNEAEYLAFPSVAEMFSPNGMPAPGIVTTHDSFAVAFSENEIIANVETLLRSKTEKEARKHFRLCSQDQWNYATAKRELADGKWRKKIIPLYYRPFDTRYTVYDSNVAVHRRERVTHHIVSGGNVAMLTSRMTKGETFKHVQVTRLVPEVICMSPMTSNNGFVFPLWLKTDKAETHQDSLFGKGTRLNLGREFLDRLSSILGRSLVGTIGVPSGVTPEDIFHYAYAVFHSPTYRGRYAEFLKIDFPRLPLTSSLDLFGALAKLGGELVALHLMESPELDKYITKWIGGKNPEVEKVTYSDETVWTDKTQTDGFAGVSENVWNFHIGGYQVCEKWLKDRQAKGGKNPRPGRVLTKDEIDHYQKIIVAISETIRIMAEIDEVIDQHGGWPDAFVTGDKKSEL